MRGIPIGKINIATAILLAVITILPGCITPDQWYDIDQTVYEDSPEAPPAPRFDRADDQLSTKNKPATTQPEMENGYLPLSIEQTVFTALHSNRELQVENFGPVIAGTFEKIERGDYDPEVFSELSYNKERTSETSRSTGERFSVEGEDLYGELGLRQKLPTGTDLETSLSMLRSDSNRTPEQAEAKIGISVNQSLLRGLGPAVNLAGVRQAQLGTEASIYELRGFVEALVAEVETAYWRYVLAEEGLEIYRNSLTVARQQLDEVEKRIEVGVLPRNAAAAARAEAARREQEMIEARSSREEYRLRLLRLLNLGDSTGPDLIIEPTSPPRTETPPLTATEEHLDLADRMRPDLNEARLRRDHYNLEVVRTRNGLMPKLDLFIDLGKTGYAESFGKAVDDLDGSNYELTAGLRFSSYLGNRAAESYDLAARASRAQAEAAIDNLRSLVKLDVRLAINETERTRRQIEASTVTRHFQEQALQAEQERFAIGASTSLLVAQAQRDLLLSQLSEIEAVIDYRIALVNLFRSEGSLLERRGIKMFDTE